jgi:hypothetical protein
MVFPFSRAVRLDLAHDGSVARQRAVGVYGVFAPIVRNSP